MGCHAERDSITRVNVFPDIDEYAFLSDCETNALVAPSGQVEWLSVPRPDSASIFGAVLDRSAGLFGFGPAGIESADPQGALLRTHRGDSGRRDDVLA